MALWRNRLALVKSEETYGTSSSPAASDALLFTELDIEPLSLELIERGTIQSYMGNRPSVVGQRSVPVNATVEAAGSGTAGIAPRYGPLLKAAGLSETVSADTSVTYAPVSDGFSSYTMDFYIDNGSRQAITGIRGNAELSMAVGEVPTIAFSQMGIFAAPGALSRPTETYSAQASPVAVNADNTTSVSVHGFSACMTSFSLNLGVEMTFEQKAGCTKQVRITDRKPTGSITIELPGIATKDFIAIASAQTAGAMSWVHGGTAGNILTFSASSVAFDSPSFEDGDSVTHVTLPFRLLGNTTWTLAYT
ncbi:MAG: hypothetical protein ACO3GP_02890 [Candidatus Limnocylindrus sp.]